MRTEQGSNRVVSKAHYVGIVSERIMRVAVSGFFYLAGISGMIMVGLTTLWLLFTMVDGEVTTGWRLVKLIVLVASFLFFMGLIVIGRVGFKTIAEEEAVVPLTRQTALDIPAKEILVRASCADTLADKTILLRPAQEQTNTASEELLRSHSSL